MLILISNPPEIKTELEEWKCLFLEYRLNLLLNWVWVFFSFQEELFDFYMPCLEVELNKIYHMDHGLLAHVIVNPFVNVFELLILLIHF